ncbi:UbiD family decarboxylase [Gloeocapsa sp. PCC 73106]|uniref:UbiD family decarboxylase n=1 Tax=Gloeocapsa sp. PCC 73106 TaxID=102232 RepID=UPI0002ABC499|nr:UbiD family decarboxylase [Gloeocapsa sp. PCC 73106]ELR98171.1 UbiD family decarboxylase [Gloeocapsa sp. PCC 73106]
MARDLRKFIEILEQKGQLRRIQALVDPDLEIAEIANRMLQAGGPALLFEQVKGSPFPVAINLMGTVERICWAMNMDQPEELETLGKKLAMLQQPKPPKKIAQAIDFGKVLFDVLKAKPSRDFFPPCQEVILTEKELDLGKLPLIRPYPGDAGKIITLGLVITRDCETGTPNVGVYRLQLQSPTTMTVHWLSVRGGARHLRKAALAGKKLEIAIALGIDPLLIMAAATPIPVDLSEWLFAGLYSGEGVKLAKCKTLDLEVPADAEIVLEGTITPGEVLPDGPFGDHMGYYGGVEDSPLIRFHCLTHRKNPIYLTTFSGRPPKEEAMMAIALNRIYTPILRQQVSEIVDFFLPMEALSYKAAIISIDKAYPGQARRAALAFWSALPQFTYTKFVIVVDKNINIRDPRQVVWAISSKVDPVRDVFILPETPFDTLDFASQKIGLGGRMGIDATTKITPETDHPWGESLESDPDVAAMVARRWQEYGLADLNLGVVDPTLFGYDLRG